MDYKKELQNIDNEIEDLKKRICHLESKRKALYVADGLYFDIDIRQGFSMSLYFSEDGYVNSATGHNLTSRRRILKDQRGLYVVINSVRRYIVPVFEDTHEVQYLKIVTSRLLVQSSHEPWGYLKGVGGFFPAYRDVVKDKEIDLNNFTYQLNDKLKEVHGLYYHEILRIFIDELRFGRVLSDDFLFSHRDLIMALLEFQKVLHEKAYSNYRNPWINPSELTSLY